MSMDIKGPTGQPIRDASESAGLQPSPKPASATISSQTTSRSATVSLTSSAKMMHELEQEIANLPVVDTKRVEGVQHAMATGALEIEPAEVANKLIEFERNLPSGG